MARNGWLGWLAFGFVSCGGDNGTPRPDPEICNDGEDNDGDGLVDCDDDNCGGLPCQDQGTPTPTGDTSEPSLLEIVIDEDCCDFTFGSADCPQKSIGTLSITNHSDEFDGQFTVSCDLLDGQQPIEWKVVGAGQQLPYLVNLPLAAESTVEVEGFFVCDADVITTFNTVCHVQTEIDEADEEFDVDHPVMGTKL